MLPFPRLFEPGQIAGITLKNRIVMAPMGTRLAQEGAVTDPQIDYYVERAKGGVGLIIIECTYVRAKPGRPCISGDQFIPGLRRLTDAIHTSGAKVAIQINTNRGRVDPVEPMSPSGVPHPDTGMRPKILSIDEIEKMVEEFGDAAVRAKKAGFDIIEVHGAHGYLIAEFLSPLTNKRTDKYGGNIQSRTRFAAEVIASIKRKIGNDFPLIFRIGADERVEGGFTIKDAVAVSQILQDAGVHAIDVDSGGTIVSKEWQQLPMGFPRGPNVHLAEQIKMAITIPVMVAGRLNDPYAYLAEKTLELGKTDFVCFGRALLADPEFSNKTKENRIKDIRPCISCQYCSDRTLEIKPVTCAVNPAAGREKEFKIGRAEKAKKVLVAGGGPAGIQTAIVAAKRGHRVTLCEKQDSVGGLLLLGSVPPHKEEILDLVFYLKNQLKESGVDARLCTEVTAGFVEEFKPDAVILAVGAVPIIPEMSKARTDNVMTALEVLSGIKAVGQEVIVIGGGLVGGETAEFLARRGKKVTLLEMTDAIGNDVGPTIRKVFLRRVKEAGVIVETKTKAIEITKGGVHCVRNEKPEFYPGATIVLAMGMKANNELAKELEGKIAEVYSVGDCVEPKKIAQAIESGFRLGMRI